MKNKKKLIIISIIVSALIISLIFWGINKFRTEPERENITGIVDDVVTYCNNSGECGIATLYCPYCTSKREAINLKYVNEVDERMRTKYHSPPSSNAFGDTISNSGLEIAPAGAVCVNHKCYINGEEPK